MERADIWPTDLPMADGLSSPAHCLLFLRLKFLAAGTLVRVVFAEGLWRKMATTLFAFV